MRIAYLILAHNTPHHMARMIGALNSPNAAFFIHVDRKSDLSAFTHGIPHDKTTFITDRVAVHWGDASIVTATLKLIERVLSNSREFEYLVLLSGSDYPLKDPQYIEEFFSNHRGCEFISLAQMPCEAVGKPIERLENYWLRTHFSSQLGVRVIGLLNRWNTQLRLVRRDYVKALKDITPYAGSQWWALTADACRQIVAFVQSNPGVVRYFDNVFAPDESLIHTIIGNSEFAKHATRSLTFTDWSRPAPKPAIIDMDHLNAFVKMERITANDPYGRGELLFARKFPDDSSELTKFIDVHIMNR